MADDLIDSFGMNQVFRDDDIPEGSDFTRVLEQALNTCSVLIAVIGPNWLRALEFDGAPRLHQPDDWVRREIEVALDRGIWVLPVLVGNATMPSTDDLPESLHSLANVQAVKMSDRSWEHDLGRLVALLNNRIPSLNSITRNHRSVVYAPTPRDTLLQLAQTIFKRQSEKRTRTKGLTRVLRTLSVRVLWLCVLLLPGWYVFDNHTTPELRKTVFDFLAFAQDKITSLINWLLPD